jgi:DNA-binding MarR family transcriptional regulator
VTEEWLDEVRRVAVFRAALRRLERTTEHGARAVGLTPRQYLLLLAVVGLPPEGGGVTLNEVAEHLQIAQSTATGLVDRAEASGLVERTRPDGDARYVNIVATALGREALRDAMQALEADRAAVAEAAAALRRSLPPA